MSTEDEQVTALAALVKKMGLRVVKMPGGDGWKMAAGPKSAGAWFEHAAAGLRLCTSIDDDDYHLSVSRRAGGKVTNDDLALVRKDFDMEHAEEDNRSTGLAVNTVRHLWLPFNKAEA